MKLQIVDVAKIRPQKCAVLPQLGSHQPKGYFDTGNVLHGVDPYVYVSVEAVETMGRMLGMASADELERLQIDLADARDVIADLEGQVSELESEIDAINVIRSKGWKPQRKPGPKKKLEDE